MRNSNGSHSKPAAVFEKIKKDFIAAAKADPEMRQTFERMRKFKGVFNTAEDAKRIDNLKNRGADKLGITVGKLPLTIGPGLLLIYDAALEAIRLDPARVNSKMFGRRAMRTAEGLFDAWLLNIGSSSVTALERALEDDEYADRLRCRAKELGWIAFDSWDVGQVCEHCTVVQKDSLGNVTEVTCPTQEECDNFLWALLLLLLLWLTVSIISWLWD